MLQRAEVDASDPTEISRHIAIVTLDAAVENAMRISAHSEGWRCGQRPLSMTRSSTR
jgi:hypothetical protein